MSGRPNAARRHSGSAAPVYVAGSQPQPRPLPEASGRGSYDIAGCKVFCVGGGIVARVSTLFRGHVELVALGAIQLIEQGTVFKVAAQILFKDERRLVMIITREAGEVRRDDDVVEIP